MKAPKTATETMLELYRHGVSLRREAEAYTLKALGIRYGISANAVWARLRKHDVEPDPNAQPYSTVLECRVSAQQDEIMALRRRVAYYEAVARSNT